MAKTSRFFEFLLILSTGLLEVFEQLEDVVIAIGRSNSKTQFSVRLIFDRSFGNNMQISWGLWITILFQLLRLDLLPLSFYTLDDFVYGNRTGIVDN